MFASSDKDEAAFDAYHKEQPWLALPYTPGGAKVMKALRVTSIPTLVLLDGTSYKSRNTHKQIQLYRAC